MTRGHILTRRRFATSAVVAGAASITTACTDESDGEPLSLIWPDRKRTQKEGSASPLQVQRFLDAINNAARTLGASEDVKFALRSRPGGNFESQDAFVERKLASSGLPSNHRNHDIIKNLYKIGISTFSFDLTQEEFLEIKPMGEVALEAAYNRALEECQRNMPSCDVGIATRFKAPGTPGGAPDWVSAWWDFSS